MTKAIAIRDDAELWAEPDMELGYTVGLLYEGDELQVIDTGGDYTEWVKVAVYIRRVDVVLGDDVMCGSGANES